MTGCIAVLNAGSSGIKFALYDAARCCFAARSRISDWPPTSRSPTQGGNG